MDRFIALRDQIEDTHTEINGRHKYVGRFPGRAPALAAAMNREAAAWLARWGFPGDSLTLLNSAAAAQP